MKKGPNLRWSLIQCSGGDEGDRTPDLLTASQALSQLSYAPVRRSTIRELGQRCKDNFGKLSAAGPRAREPRFPTPPTGRAPWAAALPPPAFPGFDRLPRAVPLFRRSYGAISLAVSGFSRPTTTILHQAPIRPSRPQQNYAGLLR